MSAQESLEKGCAMSEQEPLEKGCAVNEQESLEKGCAISEQESLEKKRTINERKNSDKSLREILGEALDRDAADAVPSPMSYEEFQSMLSGNKREERKNRRRRIAGMEGRSNRGLRIAGLAALFMIAIVGAALAFHAFTADVGANKNAPEEIITEDGVVIEDKGWGSSGEDCWTITSWDEIQTVKAAFPDLMIPGYIPEGYVFEKLTVEQVNDKNAVHEYVFLKATGEKIEIEISMINESETAMTVSQISRVIPSGRGEVYLQEDIKMATIRMDNGFSIRIWSSLSDEELVKLIDNLEV